MNVLQEKRPFQERDAISSLETVDVATGQCTVLKEFDHLIEAPNWLPTGDRLLYNAGGRLWLFDLATGESRQIDTGALPAGATTTTCSPPTAGLWA